MEDKIKKVIESGIGQVIGIAGALWICVTTVIIPINTLQTQNLQIQASLLAIQKSQNQNVSTQQDLSNRITVVETEIKILTK